MRILVWHVHGSWMNAFVQGSHTYLLPTRPERGPYGLGRAQTWNWPSAAIEVGPEAARQAEPDAVIAQRPEELEHLIMEWTGRRPGVDIPCLYLEHNTPPTPVDAVHPAAGRPGVWIVHVTHFNRLMWDSGNSPVRVIEHGVVDPGHIYQGDLARAAVVINDPTSRSRVTGTDLLGYFRRHAGIDLFGMRSEPLGGRDLAQAELHAEMARRRVYLHPNRWTSLGLSLIEAMHIGMPVVAAATTEAVEAVPRDAGVVSTRLELLSQALRHLIADPAAAREIGAAGRQVALSRYGLKRFLDDWDALLEEAVR